MRIEIVLLVVGLIGLWYGAGIIIENTKRFAQYIGISQSLIGLSVISIGTSLPEIATNIWAGIDVSRGIDASGIAIGTNIGSCMAQITLILGLTLLIGGRLKAEKRILKRDGLMVVVAILLMFFTGFTQFKITAQEGFVLIFLYLVYLYYISSSEDMGKKIKREFSKDVTHDGSRFRSLYIFLFIAVGIVILIVSSRLVVENAIVLAETMNWAKSFVAVMIIGVGTSLPELTTAIRAIREKAVGISMGTLIGSNITDPMFSLGAGALAAGTTGLLVEPNLLYFDIPFWFVATVGMLLLFAKKRILFKKHGLIFVFVYAVFATIKFTYFI